MFSIRYFLIIASFSGFQGNGSCCHHEAMGQQKGLFACDSIQLGQTSSKGVNRAITLVSSTNGERTSQNHTRLCSSSSSVHRYLEISLKDFYDICSVSAWTNTSYFRPSVTTFRIRYPTKTWTWPWFHDQYSEYYREMGREKTFDGVRNGSGIVVHNIQLTAKDIHIVPVNWRNGTCLHFEISGNIASCNDSQRRMDLWCNRTRQSQTKTPTEECYGDLKALLDRSKTSRLKRWRCYSESALTPDLKSYDANKSSSCYFNKGQELRRVLNSCSNNYRTESCQMITDDRNKTSTNSNTTEPEMADLSPMALDGLERWSNKTSENWNTSNAIQNTTKKPENTSATSEDEAITNSIDTEVLETLTKMKEKSSTPLPSREILEIVNILEDVPAEDILGNASQHIRDQIAQDFLELSSSLLNENNIPAWTSSLSNSSTLTRLWKVVEDFGVAFAKYLECDGENERAFSFVNIELIAKSCLQRSAFPLKLNSDQGSALQNVSQNNSSSWSDIVDSATIPEPLLNGYQTYQVSFVSYKNAHRLLPVKATPEGNISRGSIKVDSRILSITVKPEGLIAKDNPVLLTLRPFSFESSKKDNFNCGFWNFSANGRTNGAWSTSGCILRSINASQVTCQCGHLTNFALLLRLDQKSAVKGIHRKVLKWMTYLGCSLSLAAEIICLLAFILLTKRTEVKIKIHCHLVACLAASHFIFLVGIERNTISEPLCRIIAVSLHFLFLATFMWMLVEGIYILAKVYSVFQEQFCSLPRKTYLLAYGLPLGTVSTTYAIKFNDYGTLHHCWLAFESGVKWSFIGPVCSVLIINFLVLVLVLRRMTGTQMFRRRNELQRLRLTVRASLVMLPVLGLSWSFGLLALNQGTLVFQYLFVGFNSLQGCFIFFNHCASNTEVRAGIKSLIRRRQVEQQVTKEATRPAPLRFNSPQDHKHKVEAECPSRGLGKNLASIELMEKPLSNNLKYSIPCIVINHHVEEANSLCIVTEIPKSSRCADNYTKESKLTPQCSMRRDAWKVRMC
ncbi:adhesion G protein-coupled receptor L4-like [Montipora foliosa]|uniref:adhesion G protein-coupled receptor L4-like n=1 Tax=Montipora foliosa TaxID=591990 RepID=UPI0035F1CEFB